MPNFILSLCGTSLLTNQRSPQDRELINRYSNYKKDDEVPDDDRQKLKNIIEDINVKTQNAGFQDIAKMSAELHALVKFYDYKKFFKDDFHQLLCTNTWLGKESAKIVQNYIKNNGCETVELHEQTDLQTSDMRSFQLALSEIVKWLDSGVNIQQFKKSNYKIIFNLTGGFKSVNGFLQALASFYADEVIYVFESEKELLRIPRLPIKIDLEAIKNYIKAIRRLSLKLNVSSSEVHEIPETLIVRIDDEIALSPWGEVVWEQSKKEIYSTLLDPPYDRIIFSENFKRDIEKISPDRVRLINERVDDLVHYLERNTNPRSLDVKKLKSNLLLPSTHECDAWSDADARRIFFHYEGDRVILDKLDKGLH